MNSIDSGRSPLPLGQWVIFTKEHESLVTEITGPLKTITRTVVNMSDWYCLMNTQGQLVDYSSRISRVGLVDLPQDYTVTVLSADEVTQRLGDKINFLQNIFSTHLGNLTREDRLRERFHSQDRSREDERAFLHKHC
jgi:hypothetical protein